MDLHLIQRPMNPKRTNNYHYYLSTSPIYKKNYFMYIVYIYIYIYNTDIYIEYITQTYIILRLRPDK